jgi:uncharacterized membrane protein
VHLDKQIDIAAPPARVFAWLLPDRQARWDPSVVRAQRLPGERFERVVRAQGHRFESQAVVTDASDARRFAWRQVSGDFALHEGAFELEAVPGGTRVHLVADVEYPYQMPQIVTEEDLRREASQGADEALLRLKEILESGASA